MAILDELNALSAAEEFFTILNVNYDPSVVHVARLHILRRMGQYLRKQDMSGLNDDEIYTFCREQLEKAYTDFTKTTPIEERLFKVHKDAVVPKEPPKKPFVPLTALTGG